MHKYANGLGPTSWGKWCILLPYRIRFNEPAVQHDISYCIGGTWYDKIVSDYDFLKGCLAHSGYNPCAILVSLIYYIAVSIFGFLFFNYTKLLYETRNSNSSTPF